MGPGDARPTRLNQKTLLPIGLAFGIMVTFITATWWLRGALSEITYSTNTLGDRIGRLEKALSEQSEDRITKRDLQAFAMMLKAANPTLNIPDFSR